MTNHGPSLLALTAEADVKRSNEVISKCFKGAADAFESDFERQIFLDCMAVFAEEVHRHGNVVSDDAFAADLAKADSRFIPQKQVISSDELYDHAAMQQADSHRKTVRATANAVDSVREEALALSTEILHLEIASMIQKNKVVMEPNELQKVPEELRAAIADMETAIEATKSSLGKYDALPTNIKELEDLLQQIQNGINMGPSQTQDAIDSVTEGLRNSRKPKDGKGKSPKDVWADVLGGF